jgi:hypothetical protein
MTPEDALKAAMDIVGGPAAMAREVSTPEKKITSQAVGAWKRCPRHWAQQVYEAVQRAKKRKAPTLEQLCPGFNEEIVG